MVDLEKRLNEEELSRAFKGVWDRVVHYDEVQGENMGLARGPIPPRTPKP